MSEQTKWTKFRRDWIKDNPPNHQGAYICGICGRWVYLDDLELDHITPQGWTHARQYDRTNIQPTHARCNRQKGSKRYFKTGTI